MRNNSFLLSFWRICWLRMLQLYFFFKNDQNRSIKKLNYFWSQKRFLRSRSWTSWQLLTLSRWLLATLSVLNVSWGQAWNLRSVGWLVSPHFSRRTAPRILAKLGMNVPYYKNKKVTRPFVREKSGSFNNRENVPKMAVFWLRSRISWKPDFSRIPREVFLIDRA